MGKCVGICSLNFADEEYATQMRESSEKAAYPATNVVDLDRRTRIWRTDGFFRVVEGENTIVFRETAGVDLEATVAAGEYGTLTLFLAAVKTALDAAGVATYTVDTNGGKVRITSNLGGGATVFQLMTTDAAMADMAEMMGYGTDANFTGASAYTADVLRIHSEEWLEWDLGQPTNPKAFVLAGDRNAPLKITPSCTVKLQANWTRNWESPALDLTVPYDEFVLALWDLENGLASNTYGYRYWRAKIVDPSNTRQYVEFGVAYLGDVYVTTRGCAVFPLDFGPQDLSTVVYAEAGQAFGQKLPTTSGVNLQWEGLTKQEELELRAFFERVGRHTSFFIILDSDEQDDETGAFSVNQRDWVKLVKFQTDPRYRLVSPNNFSGAWALREEL